MIFEKLCAVTAWASLAFIAYATVAPIEARPALPDTINVGPIEHIAAFALFGSLLCFAYPRHTIIVWIVVISAAGLLEFAQTFTPDRHARLSDALQKMAGGVVGILVAKSISAVGRWLGWSF
jgi:VanZ family protein